MGKVLFFDIDGTLIPFQGEMQESTKQALRKAKENGHKIVICSGRSGVQLQKALKEIEFDGYIMNSGAYVEDHHEVIFRSIIENEELEFLLQELEMVGAVYSAQTKDGVITTPRCVSGIMQFHIDNGMSEDKAEEICANRQIETCLTKRHDIEKFVYYKAAISVEQLRERIGDRFEIAGFSFDKVDPYSGEITAKGIHKASGMEKYLSHYGMTREDSIAFGDGSNDFEMIDYAGIGVVMGNGIEALKKRADFITASVEDDGIQKALLHFGLI